MTSVNQTSLLLLTLDKALIDNADRLTQGESRALLLATFKTIVGAPVPAEAATDTNHKERKVNANSISNR